MKNVLCFGDSLTWGFDAQTGGRLALDDRWPTALSKALGSDVHIIAEGLNGRTTAFDDYTADCDRNGVRLLPTLLATHKPLDLVIVLLGTNDLKQMVVGNAVASVKGLERLIRIIQRHESHEIGASPDILIVSPPKFCETANTDIGALFVGGMDESRKFPTLHADLADAFGCGFFDANSVCETTPLDGIHMDAKNTKDLGEGLASTVKLMLGL